MNNFINCCAAIAVPPLFLEAKVDMFNMPIRHVLNFLLIKSQLLLMLVGAQLHSIFLQLLLVVSANSHEDSTLSSYKSLVFIQLLSFCLCSPPRVHPLILLLVFCSLFTVCLFCPSSNPFFLIFLLTIGT